MIRRVPPCPEYDTQATTAWLEAMAAKGWFLDKNGFRWGLAYFHSGEPQAVRYRVDPIDRKKGDCMDLPAAKKLIMYADFGWNYAARRGSYYYFRCDDPTAPEMNSDPEIQSSTLKIVQRKHRGYLFYQFFLLIINFYIISLKGAVLMIPVIMGLPFFLLLVAMDVMFLGYGLKRLWYLRKLRIQLSGKVQKPAAPPSRAQSWRYWFCQVIYIVLVASFYLSFALLWSQRSTREETISLESYASPLPFATLADLLPEGEVRYGRLDIDSTLSFSDTTLAPAMIDLRQCGDVYQAGTSGMYAILLVDYYQLQAPWMARELAREIQRRDHWENWRDYTELTPPDLEADTMRAYQCDLMEQLILTQGSRVFHLRYWCDGSMDVDWMTSLGRACLER